MPWTVCHPAILLPFRRYSPRPVDFAALVIGSMTPDLGYYINNFALSTFAHTIRGLFLVCWPTGVVLMLVFYLFCRPVCYALPAPHRQLLLPLCPDFPTDSRGWVIVLLSLLLGAWSHIFWDAFTHEQGWFVERISFLRRHVVQLGNIDVQVYLVLQEISTVIGFIILVVAYSTWLRRQPVPSPDRFQSETWRYLFWVAIAATSLVFGYLAAAAYANTVSATGFLFWRMVVFRTAVYATQICVPLILVATAIIYAQRQRSSEGRTASQVRRSNADL